MPNKLIIREDFRRDGLAINFLVNEELMLMVARAFPGSILQVGYPAICSKEFEMCHKILKKLEGENIEPALSGHALKGHLDKMGLLVKPYPKATANIWIPVSDYLIARTLKLKPDDVLNKAINLIKYWYQNYAPNLIDIALVDCTENEDGIEERVAFFSKELHDAGARSVVICDTKGQSNPHNLQRLFETIRKENQRRIEFHPHNDNGNGLENVKVAIKYDVSIIGTALFNAGERFSMIDPRELISVDAQIEYRPKHLIHFETLYQKLVGLSPGEIKKFFSDHIFITGTQYRLFDRINDANLLLGVTSDIYMLAKMLLLDREQINPLILEWCKNQLYKEKKLYLIFC